MKVYSLTLCTFFFLCVSCAAPPKATLPFNFNHPDEVIKLPQKLHEISGITFYKKKELACIQDEKGVVYFYDIKKEKLRNTTPFAKDKDYEGITNVNDTLYVLCSNGEISEIDSKNEDGLVNTYSTFLNKQNNCEGLCYDNKLHRLLIACKGIPNKGSAGKGMKAIYSFNLTSKTMDKTPVYIIDPDSVKKILVDAQDENIISKLFKNDSSEKGFLFEPSELCIDPITEDVYILSSVGKTILALTSEGKLKFSVHLNPELYKQPEGLTFSKDGTMYISDEGKGGKANLIKISRLR